MVTTAPLSLPPPFLARISAGPEEPRRRRRGDSNCENQLGGGGSCCLAGTGPGARPALKRVRRRKGKIRAGPAGLLPARYQHYQQHRAGLPRRPTLAVRRPPTPGLGPEEPPASATPRPAPGKALRKEVRGGRGEEGRGLPRGVGGALRGKFPLHPLVGEEVRGGGKVPLALIGGFREPMSSGLAPSNSRI